MVVEDICVGVTVNVCFVVVVVEFNCVIGFVVLLV